MIRLRIIFIVQCLALLLMYPLPGLAASLSSAIAQTDQTELRVFSAISAVGNEDKLPLGLEMVLKPGWKTYWRSPGDAGFPLTLELKASENVASYHLQWPAPHRFELFGLQTFGYADKIVFPIDLDLKEKGKAARALFNIRYLVCEKICVPYETELRLDIPSGNASLTDDAALLNEYRSQVPQQGSGLRIASMHWDGTSQLSLEAISDSGAFQGPDLLIEGPGYSSSKPDVVLDPTKHRATMTVVVTRDLTALPSSQPVTLTLIDGKRGIEQLVSKLDSLPRPSTSFPWSILWIALLGGFILNAMPCVLPVLLLKLTSLAELGGKAKVEARISLLSTAAGIIFSFLLIASFLIALKAVGGTIGWGIQFQQPLFLAFLLLACLLFAANLAGFFSLPVPAWADVFLRRATGRHVASFSTGCLATLMATPCSAPFVGTAIAFALAGSSVAIASIFAVMGIGLAMPYLVIAAAPSLVGYIPRPGKWMRWFKAALALSLVGTALWLGAILFHHFVHANTPTEGLIHWRRFDADLLRREVEQGKTVFVDVTADWCLTCVANERLVLDQADIVQKLNGIVTMRADWTQPDPAISAFLMAHRRYGIPFNVVYGAHAPDGIVLPEILSRNAVIEALEKAK